MHSLAKRRMVCAGALLLTACSDKTVELSGRVYEGIEQRAVADDASLEVVSFDGERLGEATTDADGRFAVDVPMDVNVFVQIADADAPTVSMDDAIRVLRRLDHELDIRVQREHEVTKQQLVQQT